MRALLLLALAACGSRVEREPGRATPAPEPPLDAAPRVTCTTAARHALAVVFPDDVPAQHRWLPDAITECVKRRLPQAALDCAAAAADRPSLEACLQHVPTDARNLPR